MDENEVVRQGVYLLCELFQDRDRHSWRDYFLIPEMGCKVAGLPYRIPLGRLHNALAGKPLGIVVKARAEYLCDFGALSSSHL
jgi:hypothetical protein